MIHARCWNSLWKANIYNVSNIFIIVTVWLIFFFSSINFEVTLLLSLRLNHELLQTSRRFVTKNFFSEHLFMMQKETISIRYFTCTQSNITGFTFIIGLYPPAGTRSYSVDLAVHTPFPVFNFASNYFMTRQAIILIEAIPLM